MSRILIADDDPDVLDCMAMVLGENHEVVVAMNGEEAVTKAITASFDLIVLDLMMPLGSGGDVVRQLKTAGVTTPILLASAASDLAGRAAALDVQAHIRKPYDFKLLEEKVAECIAARSR